METDNTINGISVTSVSLASPVQILRQRISRRWGELAPSAQRLCRHLTRLSVEEILGATAQTLGAASGTSNATVVRAVRALGYSGLSDLKNQLAVAHPGDDTIESRVQARLRAVTGAVPDVVDAIVSEAHSRVEATAVTVGSDELEKVVGMLAAAPYVHTYGVGISGLAAEYLAVKLTRIGRAARYIGADGFKLADALLHLRRGDVVLLIMPARILPDAVVLLDRISEVGASSVLVTSSADTGQELLADATIIVPDTRTGITNEVLGSMLVADILLQLLATADDVPVLAQYQLLTRLREQLGCE